MPLVRLHRWLLIPMLALPLASTPVARAGTIVLHGQDEELQNARRAQWIERIHRAAPGVDWRQIAAANREQTRLMLDGARRSGPYRAGSSLSGAWSELGADGTTGRNECVALSALDSTRIYVGSALGGMWSGTLSGGPAWTPLTDALGIGVQQIAVIPHTGRDNFVLADGGSMIYYTIDGGASWHVPAGLSGTFWNARRLVQDASSPTRVFALLDDWYWNGVAWQVQTQLFRSENGGATFVKVHVELAAAGVDVWMNRVSGGALWMLAGNVLSESTDHGTSFTVVSTLPAAGSTGVCLAGSEAGAPKLYAAVSSGGAWQLYSSVDAGLSWRVRTAPADAWGVLSASIGDSSLVFLGGVECHRSTDGGATFASVNAWTDYYGDPVHKLHADVRGIQNVIVPTGPSTRSERVYISTDGGTYVTDLAGSPPLNLTLTGFRNAQYYSVRSSRSAPGTISAGSQDQGYQTTTAAPAFTQQISGDYGHLTGTLPSNDMVWSVYPGFILVQLTENPVTLEAPSQGTNFPNDPAIPWMPDVLAVPGDPTSLLFGGRYLWRITRTGANGYVYANLWDFDGGIGDAVGAVAVAPTDTQRWYVATYSGSLYYSADGGASFTLGSTPGPPSHYFYGSDVLVSPTNPLLAYVGGSGISTPAVYRTTDGGATWAPYATGLPSTLVHRIVFDNAIDQNLYAATEAGPFACVGGTWQNLLTASPGAPLTDYWDAESLPDQVIVRFATYGRGLWDYHTGNPAAVTPGPAARTVWVKAGPNPVRDATRLSYSVPRAGPVRIEVFDVIGRRVAAPLDRWCPAGQGAVRFAGVDDQGHPLADGIYLVRIQAGAGRDVEQMVVAR